jgi:hypothetical protein
MDFLGSVFNWSDDAANKRNDEKVTREREEREAQERAAAQQRASAQSSAQISAAAEGIENADDAATAAKKKRMRIRNLSGGKTLLADNQQTLGGSSLLGG